MNIKQHTRNIILTYKYKIILHMMSNGLLNWMGDKAYLELAYKTIMNEDLDLTNPQTFNQKLQWLKLYDRNPKYTHLVDKYEVRKYISNKIGDEYLVPLIGVYDNFEDINFDNLPNKFVLKTTHDSGGVVICYNKKKFNIEQAKEKINKSLKNNYYNMWREWPYKNVIPRIICEQFIETKDGRLPVDYKFHCFNGKPDNVMVCVGRETGKPKFYFFDENWNLLKYNITGKNAPNNFKLDKPDKIDEMFKIARILSKELPFIRVDLYCEDDKIYFGELTFFPQSGFDSNLLKETDLAFGEKIILMGGI